jgi:hypothetical protein
MRPRILLTCALLACGSACQTPPGGAPRAAGASVTMEEPDAWREVASADSEAAIDGLPARWSEALDEARRAGLRRTLAGAGALLDPGTRLPRAAPAPGSYRCRLIRIGAGAARGRAYSASRPAFCFVGVEGDQLSLTTEIAVRRLGGYLWEETGGARLVFLGTAVPAGAKSAGAYGENAAGDVAGLVERVGPFRYRLVVPGGAGEAKLMIFDLVAAPAAPPFDG